MNKVQLIYNPYQETSRILINGNSISEYSQLVNYLQESFEVWSSVILQNIEQELNDDFELEIVSDKFHAWILREIAQDYKSCISIKEKEFSLNQSVLERFEKVEKFGKINTIKILIFSKNRMLSTLIFGELCKSGAYDVKQSSLYFQNDKIECIVTSDISLVEKTEFTLVICVEEDVNIVTETLTFLNLYSVNTLHFVGIQMTTALMFERITNNIYYFQSDYFKISKLIDDLIKYLAIVPYIKQRKEILENIECNPLFDSKEMQLDYLLIDAVEPLIFSYCDTEVEEGKAIKLEIATFPENIQLPEIVVRIGNPSVLNYSDGWLYGILDGETDVEVCVSGSVKPIYHNHIRVKRIIRITALFIESSSMVLKEKNSYEIGYRYEPKDADNIDEIEWISTNEQVLRIISKGKIECVAEGNCEVIVRAGNINEKCKICVKPEMKKIILPNEQIILSMGQQIPFVPQYEPTNCFDSKIFIDIVDSEIVTFDKGRLVSKGLGKTQVIFRNRENTVNEKVQVVVQSTLYASEKSNIYKLLSFIIAIISIFVLMVNKVGSIIGVIFGIIMGIMAVVKDYENVEGILNVRGEQMKADCFGSILFIVVNLLIGIFAIL